jgi:hypothetical protein
MEKNCWSDKRCDAWRQEFKNNIFGNKTENARLWENDTCSKVKRHFEKIILIDVYCYCGLKVRTKSIFSVLFCYVGLGIRSKGIFYVFSEYVTRLILLKINRIVPRS